MICSNLIEFKNLPEQLIVYNPTSATELGF